MSEQALTRVERSESYIVGVDDAISPKRLLEQVSLIQNVMRSVMKDKEHYGLIPGCGDKPSLLKPGAEKLCFTFRMDPEFEIEVIDMGKGHREYRIKCTLYAINGGARIGSGVGSASTMESKWRFRSGPKELTEQPVPKEYWDNHKTDFKKALEAIGGKGHSVAKGDDGKWYIAVQGEKVENDNPADVYNTVLKMSKKRAMVDAVLTCTAASDIFTQDVEELVENEVITPKADTKPTVDKPAPTAAATAASPPPAGPGATPAPASEESEEDVRRLLMDVCLEITAYTGMTFLEVLHSVSANKEGKYGVASIDDLKWTMKTKAGKDWSPLKSVLSKAKDWRDAEVAKGVSPGGSDVPV